METITIEFQPNVKDKILSFLNSFSKNELHIIDENRPNIEDKSFEEYRDRLHLEVKRIASGDSKTYDLDELDAMLEKIISENEN